MNSPNNVNNGALYKPHTFRPFPEAVGSTQTISISPGMRFNDIIQQASDYSTIIVESGKYLESIRVTKPLYFQANGKVSLRSDGANECIIVTSPYACFTGFSIKQKSSKTRGAVRIISGAVVFQNCVFKALSMSTIQVQNDSLVQFKSCKVYGSKNSSLRALNKSQIESINTTFSNSMTTIISLANEVSAYFSHCNFNESRNGGILSSESSLLLIDNSNFNHSMVEFRTNASGCCIDNCTFTNDSLIKSSSNNNISITRNTLSNSLIQTDGNSSSILNSNKYNSSFLIVEGSSITTAENEYFTGIVEASIRVTDNAKFNLKNSSLSSVNGYGIVSYGQSSLSIENCQISSISNNSIVCHSGCDVFLSNVTIQNANLTPITFNSINQASLSQIRVEGCKGNGCEINGCEKKVKIHSCVFNSNKKSGIVLINNLGGVLIDGNSAFIGNNFSGIHLVRSSIEINGSIIQQNAKGGIFASQFSQINATKSSFANNSWSAIHVDQQSQLQIDLSTFQNNNISINIDGTATISNCKFARNVQKATIQVNGNATISNSEFSEDKCPLIVTGILTVEKSIFSSSENHIEIQDKAQCKCIQCQFIKAISDCAIHVIGNSSSLILQNCNITQNNLVGIATEGNTSIYDSIISKSGKIGIWCNKGSKGEIKKNEITGNGESAILCNGGSQVILDNNISNNSKFGIFIASKVSPTVEGNTFNSNSLANIWHTE